MQEIATNFLAKYFV